MKFHARLQRGTGVVEQDVELMGNPSADGVRHFRIGDETFEARCDAINPHVYSLLVNGRSYRVSISHPAGEAAETTSRLVASVGSRQYRVELRDPRQWRRRGSSTESDGPQEILAPMPGKIVKVLVAEGEEVQRNQGLLVIEAMKMQNELRAPRAGRIERIYVAEARGVESGARLLKMV